MSSKEPKIKNITALRDHALLTIEKLADGDIDTAEAGATGKLCEGVVSTIKAQLEYYRMIGKEANIPFIEGEDINRKTISVAPERRTLSYKDQKDE